MQLNPDATEADLENLDEWLSLFDEGGLPVMPAAVPPPTHPQHAATSLPTPASAALPAPATPSLDIGALDFVPISAHYSAVRWRLIQLVASTAASGSGGVRLVAGKDGCPLIHITDPAVFRSLLRTASVTPSSKNGWDVEEASSLEKACRRLGLSKCKQHWRVKTVAFQRARSRKPSPTATKTAKRPRAGGVTDDDGSSAAAGDSGDGNGSVGCSGAHVGAGAGAGVSGMLHGGVDSPHSHHLPTTCADVVGHLEGRVDRLEHHVFRGGAASASAATAAAVVVPSAPVRATEPSVQGDIAYWYRLSPSETNKVRPGDIVCLNNDLHLTLAAATNTGVCGVVVDAARPWAHVGLPPAGVRTMYRPVTMLGRVPVRVAGDRKPQPGDLLVPGDDGSARVLPWYRGSDTVIGQVVRVSDTDASVVLAHVHMPPTQVQPRIHAAVGSALWLPPQVRNLLTAAYDWRWLLLTLLAAVALAVAVCAWAACVAPTGAAAVTAGNKLAAAATAVATPSATTATVVGSRAAMAIRPSLVVPATGVTVTSSCGTTAAAAGTSSLSSSSSLSSVPTQPVALASLSGFTTTPSAVVVSVSGEL